MKVCPKCQNKYTDTSLKFCLQDGSELVSEDVTEVYDTYEQTESETVISSRKPEQIAFDLSDSQEQIHSEGQGTKVSTVSEEANSSKTLITVLLTAFVMLLIFSFAGIGAYYYLSDDAKGEVVTDNKNESNDKVENVNSKTDKTVDLKTPTPEKNKQATPKKSVEPTRTPTPDQNPEQTKKDVSDTIYIWKSLAEARNLNAYMKKYAAKLDYYNKKNASKNFVQKDKQKAFTKYDSIKSKLSNMTIKPFADGKSAVAEFDKEWVFTNLDGENSGKVRSQLKLKKVGENWLIISEKDLKVYYVNK